VKITQGLRRAAQIRPAAKAAICNGREKSWPETLDRVSRLAGGFGRAGLKSGDRIALLMSNSDYYFEGMLAIMWAGAVMVPLNTRWSATEIDDALNDCGAVALIVSDDFVTLASMLSWRGLRLLTGAIARPGLAGVEEMIADAFAVPDAPANPDDLAAIFYTGGTTGRSKGVMLCHRNLAASAHAALAEGLYGEQTTYLHVAPMFHIADASAVCALTLSAGTSVFLARFDPRAVCEAISEHAVTEIMLVPAMIQRLVTDHEVSTYDLRSLQTIIYGASPISDALLSQATERFGGARWVTAYGMTELSPTATFLSDRSRTGPQGRGDRGRSVGRAVIGCEVRIVDADGAEAPRGSVGQIVVRGDNVMLGYWNRPEETAAALIEGWMQTGDGGWMDDDGFVFIADRLKDMIISGGENIYSVEVENAAASFPGLIECAVIGIPHALWGEAVHLIAVVEAGAGIAAADLVDHCRSRLAGYKCPRSVELRTDPLPRSSAGKVLKALIRQSCLSQA